MSAAARIADHDIERANEIGLEVVVQQRGLQLKGRVEMVGPCPRCGGSDRFAINVVKGVFNCRGCGGKGRGSIALVRFLDGCEFREAVEALIGGAITVPEKSRASGLRAHDDAEHERRQHRKARWMWSQRRPIEGTIAETYLREARGISGSLPPTLGFLPARKPDQHPALIIAYGLPDELEPGLLDITEIAIPAVQLTLLKTDGRGKADVAPNKISIGSPSGMPMVLGPMNDLLGLAVCEGVEDALSVHRATGLGAWASGGASFMPKLISAVENLAAREYDASPECVTIFAHDDEAGQRGARELACALVARGCEVFIEGLRS